MKSSIRLFAFFLMTLAGWGQAKKALPQADNLELRHLFADDEHDRGSEPFDVDENGKPVPHKEWKESPDMQVHDAVRRKRVHEMLNEGTVRTINDYTWASFIFQHRRDAGRLSSGARAGDGRCQQRGQGGAVDSGGHAGPLSTVHQAAAGLRNAVGARRKGADVAGRLQARTAQQQPACGHVRAVV